MVPYNITNHVTIMTLISLPPSISGEGWMGFPDLWFGRKPLWNWCLTPVVNFCEVRWNQLANPLSSPPRWCPWDLLRFVQKLKREWGEESNGKLPHLFILNKNCNLCSWDCDERTAFVQNWSLGAWVCSERADLGQKTLMIYTVYVCIFEVLGRVNISGHWRPILYITFISLVQWLEHLIAIQEGPGSSPGYRNFLEV